MVLLKKKNHEGEYKEIKVKILRSAPSSGEDSYWRIYVLPLQTDETVSVLSLLRSIFENLDHSLAFTGPCEKGLCGMCTVVVNGETRLACNTFVNRDITIEPVKGKKILRDLIVDRTRRVNK